MGSWLLILGLLLAAIATVACGGSGANDATNTATLSPNLADPPANQVASSTLVPPAPTQPAATVDPSCYDPYPRGAPYQPTPGAPLRLLPSIVEDPVSQRPFAYEQPRTDSELRAIVEDVLGDDDEHFALEIKNLGDGSGYALHHGRSFYSASLYKVWVMIEAFHQRDLGLLEWDEQFVVSRYYADLGLNSGEFQECDIVTVDQALRGMMGRTDNVAANLLLERVGAGNINRSLRSLGLEASGFYGDNTLPTTAGELALLLEALYKGDVVDGEASEEMLGLLRSESIDDRIPRFLPVGTEVAHKTGNWSNATHDAGIVFSPGASYVIVVLTDYGYADSGASLIAALSKAVYDHYNQG